MVLIPKEASGIVSELSKQTILIYGRAKIGKSTLCSKFESPLFLATEAGLNHLAVHKVNILSWKTFLDVCSEIAQKKHDRKTIVIDTIDNLVVLCSEYICKENGISHVSELPMGKGWHLVTSELNRTLIKLSGLPYGLVMVSHCDIETIETKTKKYNRFTISIGGKNKNIFLNMSDMILFVDSVMNKDGEEVRCIRTKPSMNYEAGDRTGKLPELLKLDYNEIVKYFKTKEEK